MSDNDLIHREGVIDLVASAKAHEIVVSEHIIDNIVRSWTFAALDQVLQETSTASLPFTRQSGDASMASSGKSLSFNGRSKEQKLSVAEQKSMIHPSRSSSLHGRSTPDMPYAQPPASGQVIFENGQYQDRPSPGQDTTINTAKNGLLDLASVRAQLLAIQRRLLEHTGKTLGWSIGWTAILGSLNGKEALTEVSLDEEDIEAEDGPKEDIKDQKDLTAATIGIFAGALKSSLVSIDQFRQAYEVIYVTSVIRILG